MHTSVCTAHTFGCLRWNPSAPALGFPHKEWELQLQAVSDTGASGQGPSGSVPQEMTISQLNEATFAKQVAAQLNEDALKNRYAHLILIADPQTLGRIRPLLHKETQERLLKDLAKDFTNAPLEDIQRALS